MISALEWVPAGVADPKPKKYEFSAQELELIQMMENQNMIEEAQAEANVPPSSPELSSSAPIPKTPASSPENVPPPTSNETTDTSNPLPADLRMDEYSSDEDDDADDSGAKKGTLLGRLLVEGSGMVEEEAYDEMEAEAEADDKKGGGYGSDSESGDDNDDDDDGGDGREMMMMEDDREYMPIDIEGLKAMGLSKIGSSAAPSYMNDLENGLDGEGEDDDDDSDAEDVQIRPNDDAVLVIAKTEDVST